MGLLGRIARTDARRVNVIGQDGSKLSGKGTIGGTAVVPHPMHIGLDQIYVFMVPKESRRPGNPAPICATRGSSAL